ncbi:MAG: UvrD-helicase domain-containing protein, partial [bacterium]
MSKQIYISDSFVDSIESLSKKDRKYTWKKVNSLSDMETSSGFSLHSLDRTDCDDSFKSARINSDLRFILSQQGNKYILLYVGHHDDAYQWSAGKSLNKNSYGALYIKDNIKIQETSQTMDNEDYLAKYSNTPSILEEKNVSKKNLIKLGIDEEIATLLYEIKDHDAFLSLLGMLPQELSEGLFDIVSGIKTINQVYLDLIDATTDSDTIENALNHKNSKRRFYFIEDSEELEYIINGDIEKWRIFLHPNQEEIVYKEFHGPALIEGGPGTGKTVVGMHRAVHLAKRYRSINEGKILFCTYSKKLANYINVKLEQLLKQKNAENTIKVRGVDSIINRLIYQYNLSNMRLDIKELKRIMENTYIKMDLRREYDFYETEYHEVIQRYYIRNLDEYLSI